MGHHNIRFTGDPNADNGVWGTPTSAANFCEEDYAVTNYVAEFVNCITNLAYIYYALRYPRKAAPGTPWHRKLDFMSLSLIGVGVCSALFHGTMLQIPQYCDDLSMLLLAGALLQPVYAAGQTPAVRHLVVAVLVAVIGGMSVVYVRDGNILIHTITFVALITFVWPRTLYLVRNTGRSAEEQRVMMGLFKRSLWAVIVGYALWNVDLEFCLNLRAVKARVGLPLSWLLELHGWWHFLTALGASQFIRLIRMVTEGHVKRA